MKLQAKMKQKAPERQVSCRKKVKSMLHDAEKQRGALCSGTACVCSQQEMRNALRAWKEMQLVVCFLLRRQNLEILIMFTRGQLINFPGFPQNTTQT